MSSSDAVNVDQAVAPVSEPKSEVIVQTAEVNQAPAAAATEQAPVVQEVPNQALPAATEQAPPVVVSEEAITAMYETIIAIAKFFHDVDPKEVFNALTAKGVPDFEELKKAFTTQILVNAEKQRIVLLLLKTDGSDLGKTTFDEFLKLAPTPAPATPVAAHDENAVAAAVSEQSASSASAPAPVAATPANVSDAAVTPVAAIESAVSSDDAAVTPAPVAATPAESNPDESIDSNASAPAPAPAPAPNTDAVGGSKKKRSQTKRKNGHHHHISRNRKARA